MNIRFPYQIFRLQILLSALFCHSHLFANTQFTPALQTDVIYSQIDLSKRKSLNLRLFPQLDAKFPLANWQLDGSFIGRFSAMQADDSKVTSEMTMHRAWLRLSDQNNELRIGLQKINFGTAKLLRSLQWFDQIDPRDPMAYTPGVKGILWRHYMDSSGNIWLWILYDNLDPMGDLSFRSYDKKIEYGGRIQLPIDWYETAFSFHRRLIQNPFTDAENVIVLDKSIYEDRFGIDAVWDMVIGFWLESSLTRYSSDDFLLKDLISTTFGGDYTFNIGNSLYTSIEYMHRVMELSFKSDRSSFLSLYLSYPKSFFEEMRFFFLSCLDCELTHISADYQRTYDEVFYNFSLFYKNGRAELAPTQVNVLLKEKQEAKLGVIFSMQLNM